MYPEVSGGMLRLHATYRHDLKIKASDEGRVMKTAAGFAKVHNTPHNHSIGNLLLHHYRIYTSYAV